MKYVVEMGSGAIPSFIRAGSVIQNLLGGGTYRTLRRECVLVKNTFILSK
jgi:hypothetical protein